MSNITADLSLVRGRVGHIKWINALKSTSNPLLNLPLDQLIRHSDFLIAVVTIFFKLLKKIDIINACTASQAPYHQIQKPLTCNTKTSRVIGAKENIFGSSGN